jgi:hypothetical protein
VLDDVHVLSVVEADVAQNRDDERSLGAAPRHGDRLSLQVGDRPDPVRGEELLATHVNPEGKG